MKTEYELVIQLDQDEPDTQQVYSLKEGDNIIGTDPVKCQVVIRQENIKNKHANITINTIDEEFELESFSNETEMGVWKLSEDKNGFFILKTMKSYEINKDDEFYLARQYKCIFREKQYSIQNTAQKPIIKPQNNNNNNKQNFLKPATKNFKQKNTLNKLSVPNQQKSRQLSEINSDDSEEEKQNTITPQSNPSQSVKKSIISKPFKPPTKNSEQNDKEIPKKPMSKKFVPPYKKESKQVDDNLNKKRNQESDDKIEIEENIKKISKPQKKVITEIKENKKKQVDSDDEINELSKNTKELKISKTKKEAKTVKNKKEKKDPKKQKDESSDDEVKSKKLNMKLDKKKQTKQQKKVRQDYESSSDDDLAIELEKDSESKDQDVSKKKKKEKQLKNQIIEEEEVEETQDSYKQKSSNRIIKTKQYNVIFSTEHPTKQEERKLKKLGINLVNEIRSDFNIVVMKEYRRRVKLLCGINKKATIVKYDWITDSIEANKVLDIKEYINEPSQDFQTKYNFNDQIKRNKGRIFQNYQFYIPPNEYFENLGVEDIIDLIETGCGEIMDQDPRLEPSSQIDKSHLIIILSAENKKEINEFQELGFNCADVEIILTSILRQKISIDEFTY